MKICRICKIAKDETLFFKDNGNKDRLKSDCKQCATESRRQWHRKNKEKINIKRREYYQIPEHREHRTDKRREWNDNNRVKMMLHRSKTRAKKHNLEFDLVLEDIQIPQLCPILGIKMEFATAKASENSPSIDRIDNTKGYTKDNIIICSWKANRLKNDFVLEDLEKMYLWMKKEIK